MYSYSTIPQRFADAREVENNEDILKAFRKIEIIKPLMESIMRISNYDEGLKEFFESKDKFLRESKKNLG
ncbi:hypothetical protein Syun_007161 [Stephania yunnanensis]|uniref:Uncharacterized protein n=1 Tax=Stephania yunnanensis TaxID=152371 RepID=A0AAP0KZ15_9MAGN